MSGAKRTFIGNSGAEAVEAGLKLARYHTRRPNVIAFLGAFHGRTMGAVSLTGVEGEVPRPLRPAAPRRLPRALRQRGHRGDREARLQAPDARRRVRGHHRGAHPGRGRLRRPRGRLPREPARAVRSPRHPAHRRRDPVGRRAHRQDVGDPALGRGAGHPAHGQGDRLRHAGRGDDRPGRRDVLGPRRPRQHLRRQPGLARRADGDGQAPRGRPHRQRRHPRPPGHGRAPAARGPVPGPRQGRPRQGPDDRDPVRLGRDRGRGPDAGVRPRPARPRGRRRLRADVPAAGRDPGRGRHRDPAVHGVRRPRRRPPRGGRGGAQGGRSAPGMPPRGSAPRDARLRPRAGLHSAASIGPGAEAHARQGRLDAGRRRGSRPRRGHGRDRGVHPPDRLLGRPRDHPPAQAGPHARAHDARPRLRPDDRRRRRAQAGLLLAGQPGRRRPQRHPPADRARIGGGGHPARGGGVQPLRHGRRATRRAPPTCRSCPFAPTSRRTCRRRTR